MNAPQQFTDFQSFDDMDTARYMLLNILEQNEIPYELSGTNSESDFIKGKASWLHSVVVKIPLNYFEKVNTLLEEKANTIEIPKQHYLIGFSDDELIEILQKPDEWSREDYAISRKMLVQRGKVFTADQLAAFKTDRLNSLAKPESVKPLWILVGFISALFGGVVGIFMGWTIHSSTKTLFNGKKYYTYDKESRSKGFTMLVTGIVCLIIWVVLMAAVVSTMD